MQHESVGMYKCGWKITITSWKLGKGVCLVCCEAAEVMGFNSRRLWNQNIRSTGPAEHQQVNKHGVGEVVGVALSGSPPTWDPTAHRRTYVCSFLIKLIWLVDLSGSEVPSQCLTTGRFLSAFILHSFPSRLFFFVCVRWQAFLSTSQIPQLLSVFAFYRQTFL